MMLFTTKRSRRSFFKTLKHHVVSLGERLHNANDSRKILWGERGGLGLQTRHSQNSRSTSRPVSNCNLNLLNADVSFSEAPGIYSTFQKTLRKSQLNQQTVNGERMRITYAQVKLFTEKKCEIKRTKCQFRKMIH